MGESKAHPVITCSACGLQRPHHAKGLCVNCYAQKYPSARRQGICANFINCPRGMEIQEIWARGLCHSCLDWFRHRGRLNEWPIPGNHLLP